MYKILSLDGGGSWALIQLLTLQEIHGDVPGHEILKKYDLVIANSGGSIVLAALAENWNISKAVELFENKEIRERIFSINKYRERYFPVDLIRLFAPFGPKYSSVRKGKAFKDLFPEIKKRKMVELPAYIGNPDLKLVVCTFDAINNRAKFFKSYGEEKEDFDSVDLTQAINGSSNAPLQYFDFPVRFKAGHTEVWYELWDGALGGFNNPVAAGVIEAFKLDIPLSEISVLSLGTSNTLISNEEKIIAWENQQNSIRYRGNKLRFGKWKYQIKYFFGTVIKQAKTILYQPPDWANYVSMMFLKSKGVEGKLPFVRLSPLIHFDSTTDAESVDLLKKLYKLDMDLTTDEDIALVRKCFDYWKAGKIKNQPIEFKVSRDNELIFISGSKTFEDGIKQINDLER